MNNNVVTTDEYTYCTGHENVVIGMRNVVMVFANMGIGNWEMGISSQIISIISVYVVHTV